jgi:hypothetical protein
MNAEENMMMQAIEIALSRLTMEIAKQRQESAMKSRYDHLPEWITLEQAVKVKGGPKLNTYRQRPSLQPCCGLNYRLVGGRRCWKKEDVIEWIEVSDEVLKKYAENKGIEIPEVYKKRNK